MISTEHTQEWVRPPLGDGQYLVGDDDRGGLCHVVIRAEAIPALHDNPGPSVLGAGVCDRPCRLGFGLGSFASDNQFLSRQHLCAARELAACDVLRGQVCLCAAPRRHQAEMVAQLPDEHCARSAVHARDQSDTAGSTAMNHRSVYVHRRLASGPNVDDSAMDNAAPHEHSDSGMRARARRCAGRQRGPPSMYPAALYSTAR